VYFHHFVLLYFVNFFILFNIGFIENIDTLGKSIKIITLFVIAIKYSPSLILLQIIIVFT